MLDSKSVNGKSRNGIDLSAPIAPKIIAIMYFAVYFLKRQINAAAAPTYRAKDLHEI